MPTTEELHNWDHRYFWHAFTQMAEHEPLIVERGDGCFLFDIRGKRYLDGVSSLWCNLHGHNHPRMNAAISDQLGKLAHATTLGMSNPPAIELARRLAELAPGDLQHVFYACDGSSAVEIALKMAFQYWQQCDQPQPKRTKYLAFGNAYHGDTIGSTAVGGIQHFHEVFGPLLCEVVRVPTPDRRHGTTEEHVAALEAILSEQHAEIAALVIEPLVQGAAGMLMQPAGYLRGVRELCTKYDVLMIADEIVTAFGRTGTMFACERENAAPDLLCLGKAITGGYLPMSATIATPRIYEAFLGENAQLRTFFHGHTYGGNPLAAAAALASLDLLEEEQVLSEQLPAKIVHFVKRLETLREHPLAGQHIGDVRQLGLLAGIELAADGNAGIPFESDLRVGYHVCRAATEAGVWLRPLGDVVIVVPPLSITIEELDLLFDVLTDSLVQVAGEVTPIAAGR